MLLFAAGAPALDPEYGVGILMLENEAELDVQFLRPAGKRKSFLRFRWHVLDLRCNANQRLLNSEKFIPIFFQELVAVLKGEAAITLGQKRKEKRGALA